MKMKHGEVEIRKPSETHGDPEVFITLDAERIEELGAIGNGVVHLIIKRKNGKEARVHLNVSFNGNTQNMKVAMRSMAKNTDTVMTAKCHFVDWT